MRRWQFWVGIIISLVFLYLTLRGLDLEHVWAVMQAANYWWLLPGIAVYFVGVWVRAWRWRALLRPIKSISTHAMFPVVTIGYMGNNIFPARAGEVLRSVILRDRENISVSTSLATIIVERIFDGMVMLAFVFLNLPELIRVSGDTGFVAGVQQVATVVAIAFIAALTMFLLAAMFPSRTERILDIMVNRLMIARWREWVRSLIKRFLTGLQALRSPQEVLFFFFATAVIWLLETCKYWFVMRAFPFQISFTSLMLVNGFVNLATMLPSAPGHIGTFDAPAIALLSAFGVNGEMAAGYTLVLHAALWFPVTLLGFYFYLRQPLRWGRDVQANQAGG
ncbi:MAG TPA: lysylphosphatidylglycerol synthase transmembrane domain-containing protein [Levilinea sp.]|nr:lysylphosphatidylglycerol synthase transmembrane domain-containing protein [Levilinea sp.]